MSDESRIIRFGIRVEGRRSRCWRLRAGAHKVELFLERENYGDYAHCSLHQSGDWHLMVNKQEVVQWPRPPRLAVERAFSIAQPAAVAVVDEPAGPEAAIFVPMTPGATGTDAVVFDLWIEPPGAADAGQWPGKEFGTVLAGRIPLADGTGTCCIVARELKLDLTSLPPPQPGQELDQVAAAASDKPVPITAVAYDDDGTVLLVDYWMAFTTAEG